MDGLVPLAWSLNDEALKQKAQPWIEWMLNSQSADGFFGPADNLDWWPRMVALKVLTQYHEATSDARVIPFLDRYFRSQLQSLPERPLAMWAAARGQEQLLPLLYLYRQTKEPYLLELAKIIRKQSYNWGELFTRFCYTRRTHAYLNRPLFLAVKRVTLISDWAARRLKRYRKIKPQTKQQIERGNASAFLRIYHETHSVNLAMALKMPALDALLGGDPAGALASQAGIDALLRSHGLANFVFSGDEHLNGRSPTVGAELCLVAEYMFSLETLLSITGESKYADRLEQVAFNTWPATFTSDMCAHQYVQQVNQVEVSRRKRDWYDAYSESNLFGLKPNFGCCAANMHQGWPKLLGSLLLTHPRGITAAVYAPCAARMVVSGVGVRLTETTNYPFDGRIRLSVNQIENVSQSLQFSFFLRIPGWVEQYDVLINDEPLTATVSDGFAELNRVFCAGDTVELLLDMPLRLVSEAEGGVSLHRGPLLLALPIAAQERVLRGTPPFADFALLPRSRWQYGIAPAVLSDAEVFVATPGEQPFGEDAPPLRVLLPMAPVSNWNMERHSAGPVPPPQVIDAALLEKQSLVPYGCTRLRIAQFPIFDLT